MVGKLLDTTVMMIQNDRELQMTFERIARMQKQVAVLRRNETNPANYRLSVSSYLAEINRMNLEVREYLLFTRTMLDTKKDSLRA